MTNEEAINYLKNSMVISEDNVSRYHNEVLEFTIKALEEQENPNSIRINFIGEKEAKEFNEYLKNQQPKESVLEKIRAEIMKLDDINPDYPMDRTIHISRNEVLQIIDKYKESEDKE